MAKYLSWTTAGGDVNYVKAESIINAEVASGTSTILYVDGGLELGLTTVGATAAWRNAINAALKTAAETKWTDAVVAIDQSGLTSIADGYTVTPAA